MSRLGKDEDLLLTNNFIDPNVYDISQNNEQQKEYLRKQMEFRKFMEGKVNPFDSINNPSLKPPIRYLQQGGIVTEPTLAVLGEAGPEAVIPLDGNNPFAGSGGGRGDALSSGGGQSGTAGTAGGSGGFSPERFSQDIHTMISIDSRDRDQTLYGKQNNYAIKLRRTFTNVTVVKLKSTEFPNTLQLIRSTPIAQANNQIYWNNEDDVIGGVTGVNAVYREYVASITPGNYDASSFATEIQTQMNAVRRNAPTAIPIANPLHAFTITIDTVTDIVTFSSVTHTTVPQPFKVVGGSSTVLTTHSAHGFTNGTRILVEDAVGFSGIPASDLNKEHIIFSAETNANEYQFIINSVSTNDPALAPVASGGPSVQIGKGIINSLLWSKGGTPAAILGFSAEDTVFSVSHTNTKEKEELIDFPITVNEIQDEGIQARVFVNVSDPSGDHGLQTGERAFITDYTNLYGQDGSTLSTSESTLNNIVVGNINDPAGHIITRFDASSFLIPVEMVFQLSTTTSPVRPSITAGDVFGNISVRELNRAVQLTGENYIMLTSPQLESMETTNRNIPTAFYKLQLSSSPGSVIFNAFVGNPKVFYDTPLTFLDELEWLFKQYDGSLFEFNDADHSFTIEIVETIQKIESIGESSKLGLTT